MHSAILGICKRRKEAKVQLTEVVCQALTEYREADTHFLSYLDEEHVCIYLQKTDIKAALNSRGVIRNTWQKFLRWL